MRHDQLIHEQFGSTAQAYLDSPTHASGDDLEWLTHEAAAQPGAAMLDLGCGAGHVSFAIAPHAGSLIACDPTPEMIALVRQQASARGFAHLTTALAGAEHLPFPDGQFDVVMSRYSAHHWRALPAALHEVHRVLRPGGRFLLVDTAGGDTPLLDTWLQAIELLRDPSHIRNYSEDEWIALLAGAGFRAMVKQRLPLTLDFASWTARMRTPPERIAAIQSLWSAAPAEVLAAYRVQPDGTFTIGKLLLSGERPLA